MKSDDDSAREIKKATNKALTLKAELLFVGRVVASRSIPVGKGDVTTVTTIGSYDIDKKGHPNAQLRLTDADGKVALLAVSAKHREGGS